MIQFRDVTIHSLAKKEVLTKVTQLFPDDKPSYIIGKSGAGKSTLLKAIFGEVPVASGEIILNDEELNYDTLPDTLSNRRKIGFIFQDFRLIESFTVFENIAYVLHIKNEPVEKIRYEVEQLAFELGIEEKLADYCHQLSGGEQQRVAIARALIKQPQVILADEPTGNLDPLRGKEIIQLINSLSLQKKITTLIVTHDYTLIPENSNAYQLENQQVLKLGEQ